MFYGFIGGKRPANVLTTPKDNVNRCALDMSNTGRSVSSDTLDLISVVEINYGLKKRMPLNKLPRITNAIMFTNCCKCSF